jgi:hypothetical protein
MRRRGSSAACGKLKKARNLVPLRPQELEKSPVRLNRRHADIVKTKASMTPPPMPWRSKPPASGLRQEGKDDGKPSSLRARPRHGQDRISVAKASQIVSGDGGQPGMARSTGSTRATRPTVA